MLCYVVNIVFCYVNAVIHSHCVDTSYAIKIIKMRNDLIVHSLADKCRISFKIWIDFCR